MKLGAEAEFLYLAQDGHIVNMANRGMLSVPDEIGCDGHHETIEIRVTPAPTAKELYANLCRSVHKYNAALGRLGLTPKGRECGIRGGSYHDTALGVHLHFSEMGGEPFSLLLDALDVVLYDGFLTPLEDQNEAHMRSASGYGRAGIASVRMKGRDGWWEWRRPYSCMVPSIMATLFAGAEYLAKLSMSQPSKLAAALDFARSTGNTLTLATLTASLKPIGLGKEEVEAITNLSEAILNGPAPNWNRDLLPLWIK